MKILHTSDWHIGKTLKGKPRLPDQVEAIAAVVAIAREQQPDLVIIAGDLYDSTAPSSDATKVVVRALCALRETGADVVAIAGNHDNGHALDALRPWAQAAGITLRGTCRSADDLVISGMSRQGEPWTLAALPFVSQRYAIRATEMFDLTAAEVNQTYADHIERLLARLSEGFGSIDSSAPPPNTTTSINIIAAHLTVVGASLGGGERSAHTIVGYAVPASIFPRNTHYVALGHIHKAQPIHGPCPIRYSGSPLAVDFGDGDMTVSVSLVTVSAHKAAQVTAISITAGTPLQTIRGTLAELSTMEPTSAWLRVIVAEPPRAGLREEIQALLPTALEIRVDPQFLSPSTAKHSRSTSHTGLGPGDLFTEYLSHQGHVDDHQTMALFHRLHDEVN